MKSKEKCPKSFRIKPKKYGLHKMPFFATITLELKRFVGDPIFLGPYVVAQPTHPVPSRSSHTLWAGPLVPSSFSLPLSLLFAFFLFPSLPTHRSLSNPSAPPSKPKIHKASTSTYASNLLVSTCNGQAYQTASK